MGICSFFSTFGSILGKLVVGVNEMVFEGVRGGGMGCGGDIPARVARYLADDAVHSSCIGIIQGADALAESRLPSHIDNQQCCF